LQDKSETQGTLKRFLRRAQNEFELKVKKIRSDNGSEFKNLQVEEYLEEEGIKHKFSAPYTPQQNGVVERKNRTLIDMARTMLGEFKTLDLVRCLKAENLDAMNSGWLGVFIAPTTKLTVGEGFCRMAHRTVRCATGHCPVRQPRHPTVRF
jgi:transposase InsO family protein